MKLCIGLLFSLFLLVIPFSGWAQDSSQLSIEEIRLDRPWISKTTILVPDERNGGYRLQDFIDYDFIVDDQLVGTWKAVDFVREFDQFKYGEVWWRGGGLMWDTIEFYDDGRTSSVLTWTKDHILHRGSKTDSSYEIVEIDGVLIMFMQHKSGDYTLRYSKPAYYVFQKM